MFMRHFGQPRFPATDRRPEPRDQRSIQHSDWAASLSPTGAPTA